MGSARALAAFWLTYRRSREEGRGRSREEGGGVRGYLNWCF